MPDRGSTSRQQHRRAFGGNGGPMPRKRLEHACPGSEASVTTFEETLSPMTAATMEAEAAGYALKNRTDVHTGNPLYLGRSGAGEGFCRRQAWFPGSASAAAAAQRRADPTECNSSLTSTDSTASEAGLRSFSPFTTRSPVGPASRGVQGQQEFLPPPKPRSLAASASGRFASLTIDHSTALPYAPASTATSAFQAGVPTHVLDRKGDVALLQEGELLPAVDLAKSRARLFNFRKATKQGHTAATKLDRKPCKGAVTGLGALNMEMLNKHRPDFSDLVTFQEMQAHTGPIWCLEFSHSGMLFATGGADGAVRVWRVTAALEHRAAPPPPINWASTPKYSQVAQYKAQCFSATNAGRPQSAPMWRSVTPSAALTRSPEPWARSPAPRGSFSAASSPARGGSGSAHGGFPALQVTDQLFRPRPAAELTGHTADVTSVAWTADGRILTASLDGTVRVWRLAAAVAALSTGAATPGAATPLAAATPATGGGSSGGSGSAAAVCERVFASDEAVACVAAHPLKPAYCVCGHLDGRVSVWDIDAGALTYVRRVTPSAAVAVTAAAFTHDGSTVTLGFGNGTVQVCESRTMQLRQTADVRTSRAETHAAVTGFAFRRLCRAVVVGARGSKARVLEASDYRGSAQGAALCEARTLARAAKLKGATVTGLTIKPSLSDDDRYVIGGSEDGRIVIWDAGCAGGGGGGGDAEPGFERWRLDPARADGDITVPTCALFVPSPAVHHCVEQVIAAKAGAADFEAVAAAAAEAAAEAAAGGAAAAAARARVPRPHRRTSSSALRSNGVSGAAKRSLSCDRAPVASAPPAEVDGLAAVAAAAAVRSAAGVAARGAGAVSSSQHRAVVHGRVSADAQRLRSLSNASATTVVGGGGGACGGGGGGSVAGTPQRGAGCAVVMMTPRVLGTPRADASPAHRRGAANVVEALHLGQGARSSAGRLQSYRKCTAAGGSDVPRNSMVIAADTTGRVHVFCRAAVAEEWSTAGKAVRRR